jgi:hypothetical protein
MTDEPGAVYIQNYTTNAVRAFIEGNTVTYFPLNEEGYPTGQYTGTSDLGSFDQAYTPAIERVIPDVIVVPVPTPAPVQNVDSPTPAAPPAPPVVDPVPTADPVPVADPAVVPDPAAVPVVTPDPVPVVDPAPVVDPVPVVDPTPVVAPDPAPVVAPTPEPAPVVINNSDPGMPPPITFVDSSSD